jgi:hypothetical protein
MTALPEAPPSNQLRAAWAAAHAPVPGVPHWARIAAYAIPFAVLPSSLWRIAGCTFHLPIATGDQGFGQVPSWLPGEVYVVLLSVLSELLAFTAVGLISQWGEVFPRWLPGLRGRRVPTAGAVVPALLGAAALTVMWTRVLVTVSVKQDIHGRPLPADFPLNFDGWRGLLAVAAYAPLLLWGPLLAAVTIAYWTRRSPGRS